MTDPNDLYKSNENGEEIRNDSSDDDEQNLATNDRTNSNCLMTTVQRSTPSQMDAGAGVGEAHQITNQPIPHESDHHALPSRRTTVSTQYRRIDTARSSTLSTDSQLHVRLGNSKPLPINHNPGLNQNGQATNHITHPSDEGEPLVITYILSTCITVYHPFPRENVGIENTQPHDMPTPTALNYTRHELVMDGENSHAVADVRAHNNPNATTDLIIHNEPDSRVIVGNNAVIEAPMEPPNDTDFSVDTFDPQSGSRLDTDVHQHERRLVSESFRSIDDGNGLANSNELTGQASPNTENTVRSNQTHITVDQSVATALSTNSSTPQALDNERNTDVPIGAVYQSTGLSPFPSNIFIPKVPSPADSGDESSEDSTA